MLFCVSFVLFSFVQSCCCGPLPIQLIGRDFQLECKSILSIRPECGCSCLRHSQSKQAGANKRELGRIELSSAACGRKVWDGDLVRSPTAQVLISLEITEIWTRGANSNSSAESWLVIPKMTASTARNEHSKILPQLRNPSATFSLGYTGDRVSYGSVSVCVNVRDVPGRSFMQICQSIHVIIRSCSCKCVEQCTATTEPA